MRAIQELLQDVLVLLNGGKTKPFFRLQFERLLYKRSHKLETRVWPIACIHGGSYAETAFLSIQRFVKVFHLIGSCFEDFKLNFLV